MKCYVVKEAADGGQIEYQIAVTLAHDLTAGAYAAVEGKVTHVLMRPSPPTLEELTERTRRLHALLNDPQPGLATWNIAVSRALDALRGW